MVQASLAFTVKAHAQPLLSVFSSLSNTMLGPTHDIVLLVVGAICAFLLSYCLMFGVAFVSRKFNLIRRAEPGRKQDTVPRLGGVGIFIAFVIASLLFYIRNPDLYVQTSSTTTPHPTEYGIYWLFLAGSALIVLVHAYDDVKPLKPLPKLIAQTIAVIIIMGPFFNGIFNGVLLYGFSNPFQATGIHAHLPWYREPILTLFINDTTIRLLAIPAVLFTWFWMVGMMNTVNLIDGLDGLSTGVVGIVAIFVTITSFLMHQYTIAILAGIFAGAVLGFLPHNWNPARMYMGDSGSQFLGLGLAVLSIMGGAKVALALMVLGIPILDVVVVIINRVRRGQHPFHYDKTHLHYRLQATGLSVKQICYVFYGLTAAFGIFALSFVHVFKLVGIALVILTMAGLIAWIDYRQRKRGTPMKLDGADPAPSGDDDNGAGAATLPSSREDNTHPDYHTSHPLPTLSHPNSSPLHHQN